MADAALDLPSPPCPPATDTARLLRRLFTLANARMASPLRQIDPEWIAGWPVSWRPEAECGDAAAGSRAVLASRHLSALASAALGMRPPALEELRIRANRLALLERADILRVLALVAVESRRDALRHCIDRAGRERIVHIVGAVAFEQLIRASGLSVGDDLPVDWTRLEPTDLAHAGFRLLHRVRPWRHRHPLLAIRLCLPPEGGTLLFGEGAPAPIADGFFEARILDYFPEFAWLFGSEMDRALSASSTASSGPTSSRPS